MSDWLFQAVLFDLDGVLLDSMEHHATTWQQVFAGAGLTVERDFILAHEGCLAEEVLERLLRQHGVELHPDQSVGSFMQDLLDQQRVRYLNEHAHCVSTFPGAGRILRALVSRGVPLALVTSSRRDQVERCLPAEMMGRFSATITSDDVSLHKPHPDPYLAASSMLDADPARCLVVENAPAGIQAALAAGATCYALTTTLDPGMLAQAHAVFDGLASLAQHLGLDQEP